MRAKRPPFFFFFCGAILPSSRTGHRVSHDIYHDHDHDHDHDRFVTGVRGNQHQPNKTKPLLLSKAASGAGRQNKNNSFWLAKPTRPLGYATHWIWRSQPKAISAGALVFSKRGVFCFGREFRHQHKLPPQIWRSKRFWRQTPKHWPHLFLPTTVAGQTRRQSASSESGPSGGKRWWEEDTMLFFGIFLRNENTARRFQK